MSEWQPIESAPRDGTEVLIWPSHGKVKLASWNAPSPYWVDGIGLSKWWNRSNNPTHWMPIPEPPK